jgi:muramoyltetrapeptide carboxypeptidase LdcA involved in peptidoglycan recycling
VRGIVTAIGGYTSNGVLPHLDYAALAGDPKVIVGYSDVTAILLAAYARTGVVTFHGPTLMPELAEYPAPPRYTVDGWRAAMTVPFPLGPLAEPPSWTEEFLRWDVDDHRPRAHRIHLGWQWLAGGRGEGRLVGGNLDTIGVLVGTPYLPCLCGVVLFWETCAGSLATVERSLCHLDAAGVTESLAGMVVGRSFRAGDAFERDLRELVTARYGDRGYPIVAGVDLGHTDPMLTLPIGATCRLAADQRLFEVLDRAVR